MRFASLGLRSCSAIALTFSAFGIASAFAATPALAQSQTTVENGQIPVAEFVKKANMSSPRISPDGKRLAYLAAANGREVLVMLDLTDLAKPAKMILEADEARESGDRTLSGFRWVGNDDLVMTMRSREYLGGELGDFGRLVAYNVSGGEIVQQAWDKAGFDATEILHIDHDKGEYLLSRDAVGRSNSKLGLPEVVRVDVKTGKYEMVERVNPVIRGWAADGNGVVRAGFNRDRDNGKFRMLYRSGERENFRTVYNEADDTFTESIPAPRMFIPGTDDAYTISRHEGFSKVYKIDMSTMSLSEPIFETEGFDVQGLITNEDDTKLIGYRIFDGSYKNVYVDQDYKGVQTILEEIFGANEVRILDYDADFNTFILYAGGNTKFAGFYLYDMKAANISLLNWQYGGLKDAPLNPVKAEWYTASDGTKIQAVVTYPRHRDPKNLPVVVMPHGGPFGVLSATNATEPWNQPLAEAGYLVIQPNYRGSGGYGKEFEQMGREPGGYGKRMQDDLNDILTYYGDKGILNPNRACIMGWSYGGYAAARGAQRDPEIWKCAIAGAGVYDMPLMNRWDAKNLGRFNSGFQATSDDPEAISSARNTDGEWAPILIVAGVRDARIPLEQSRTLVSNLKKSGKVEGRDFKYIEQRQGTHNLPYDDVHIQWIEEAEKWLDTYNPAYISSDTDSEPSKVAVR